ncbi:MAG: dipeptidyl-peptidase 3 family protein, partial [Burkholderiales bacterium]
MLIAAAVAATAVSVTFAGGSSVQETRSLPDAAELRAMTARFAPVDIAADASRLADSERRALGKLIEAARIMDALFLRQSWSGNDALLQHLSRKALEPGAADAQARLHYFLINKGPWSRLDHDRVFIPGAPAKPESANFYPAGASKEEVQKWLDSLSGEAKAQATGFFTTIRRGADGKFVSVPYSVEY